ncbi:TetR/AcrR family transcriptional regulator [Microbulbifer rhizosphaerae]|uniref:AcrR family transcriptional regulator n=1 Tax=Microbulbifer rhizosphaerae TaxID=1562603 RepID=A0A7W4Z7P1_9GAMM|nr:TetR/AcrR family transcriptional regulator [Microbulbifer rhizosphaerae]MBB3059696.1 AcrR family transcriptional regulator [Microbulbifer rhizosphaerae]
MTPRSTANKRPPGRPSRDSAELRPALIDAALTCYAREGVAATSLKAIASEAGVTPALLHYYFGNREQLRQAVIEERIMPLMYRVQEKLVSSGDVSALINTFISAMGEVVVENPWWPPLWVREVLCEGGALRGLMIDRLKEVARLFTARFATAQEEGKLNVALDPRLLLVSLIGLTLFPAAGAPIWRQLQDADDITGEDMQRHTLALLQRGLELKP